MSRSKHQTLKSVAAGHSKAGINALFAEGDADAIEWVEKGKIKQRVRGEQSAAKLLRDDL